MASQRDALPGGFEQFPFIADALNAAGGFRPNVIYQLDENGLAKPTKVAGSCYLVPYPRESAQKYAARAAVAVYENHLASACERFVGYLARNPPMREGADGALTQRFLDDADAHGNSLDVVWSSFMYQARARGTMLLLMDTPAEMPQTLAEQVESRSVPYVMAIAPELLRGYELDESGAFTAVAIASTEIIDGKDVAVIREWNATGWRVRAGDQVLREGTHPFKRCPVLAFTESTDFPCLGAFSQIAALSRRLFNAESELDEILRSQTFSLLTYQVPPEAAPTFNAGNVAAAVGTHNMLTHSGDTPTFIAPPDGPAQVYMSRIDGLKQSIRRISLTLEDSSGQKAESGLALQLRFQSLNSALGQFAMRMQDFERRVWDLFCAGVGIDNRVRVTWPLDYTLADPLAELDKLTAMQATGFPEEVLCAKRKQITAAEFSNLGQDELDELLDSIDEAAKETDPPGGDPGTGPAANLPPEDDVGDPTPPGAP